MLFDKTETCAAFSGSRTGRRNVPKHQLLFDRNWCEPIDSAEDGIVTGNNNSFGIGTLLVLVCSKTNRVLMGRKSYRVGFEGSNQFTFPGGMLRTSGRLDFEACIADTLEKRVMEESGVSVGSLEAVHPQDGWPPVVARYTIGGNKKVAAAILPFYAEVATELPAKSNDATVYSVGRYNPLLILDEITRTNALILAQILWQGFTSDQKRAIKPKLDHHYRAAAVDAALVGASPPAAPWDG